VYFVDGFLQIVAESEQSEAAREVDEEILPVVQTANQDDYQLSFLLLTTACVSK